ncbi:MAG: hypothetical protein Q4F51_10410 [Sarcina sp.]|nr:hypothetical protein [Sarcina sp.]
MDPKGHNYILEYRLRDLDQDLHRRFTDTVFAMQNTLFHFKRLFPEYTDHSSLHSMSVINFCNQLIGPEQLERLNADSIYSLLMACYLHDSGMGISMDQYLDFSKEIDRGDYFDRHPDASVAAVVRDFHQEYSAVFVRRFREFLEIPSPEHEYAIIQVCRGHRKTDLFDPSEFPLHYRVPGGNEIYLPYLASLIRLADEIDVVAARNPMMLYDIESFTNDLDISYHKRHRAVRSLQVTEKAFILEVCPAEPEIEEMIESMVIKMQETLDLCRKATEEGSPFRIRQEKVIVRKTEGSFVP